MERRQILTVREPAFRAVSYLWSRDCFDFRVLLGNLSTRLFLRGNSNRKSNLLPIHVSHRQGQPSRLCADFVLPILTLPVKREFCLNDFRAFISFCLPFLYLVILTILFYHSGAFTSDCQVFTRIFLTFLHPA